VDTWLPEPNPLLIWGLFIRGLGLVFLVTFASLSFQVRRNAGTEGGLPVTRRLARIRQDFPTWRRFYYFPSLLWLSDSDAMLTALPIVGLLASALVIYGGALSFWALLVCYVAYLSLDIAMALIFPWDSFLFECAVLSLFLPVTEELPSLNAAAAPAPALTWAFRLLLFRLMFGFGKQKFIGSRSKDLAYLKGFLIAQPLPSPIGWYFQKLPTFMLKGAVLFMFFVEVPAPFFAFIPGPLSVVFAVSTIFLMIGIQAMGSFGYFSLATMVASIILFDNTTPRALEIGSMFSAGAPILVNAFVVMHTLGAIMALPFNSWLGQSWHLWAFWYQLPKWCQFPFTFVRLLHPFRWLHPYGVFPPNVSPGVKMSLLVEVTWDKKTWHELRFRFSPSREDSPPKFVSPHHPRGDQAVIYDTFGLNPTSLVSSMLGPWDPYPFGSRSPAAAFRQKLVEGKTLDFVYGDVMDAHPEPPKMARITTIMLEPVTLEEHRKTGKWWKRSYVGPHAPPREFDPNFWDDALAEPELWHFDSIFWRRRSRLGSIIRRAVKGGEDPMSLALAEAEGLTAEHVERFWNEFVPLLPTVRESLDNLPAFVAEFEKRFDRKTRRAFYRLLGRFSLILVSRLEPHYLHKLLKPEIPVPTYFHLWMLAHYIIGCGRDEYLAAVASPMSVTKYIPALNHQNGLYALSIFRLEEMTFEAQKLRLMTSVLFPHDPAEKKALTDKIKARNLAAMTPAERLFVRVTQSVSGFFNVLPEIRDSFKGPEFDLGYPELYPTFRELDSGEVVLRAYTHPEQGVRVDVEASALPGAVRT
jgi:hypothetical protein